MFLSLKHEPEEEAGSAGEQPTSNRVHDGEYSTRLLLSGAFLLLLDSLSFDSLKKLIFTPSKAFTYSIKQPSINRLKELHCHFLFIGIGP